MATERLPAGPANVVDANQLIILTSLAFAGLLFSLVDRAASEKRAVASAERRQQLYLALARCNVVLTRRESVRQIYEGICDVLAGISSHQLVWIGVPGDSDEWVHPVVARGPALKYLDGVAISGDSGKPEGRGPTGRALRSGSPVWCNDFATDPITRPWREQAAPFGFRGSAALPILRQGRPVAVLTIYTDQVGYFDSDTWPLLLEFVSQLGFVLETSEAERAAAQSAEEARIAASEATMANERLSNVIEASMDLVCSLDHEGCFVRISNSAVIGAGWPPELMIGRSCLDFVTADSPSYLALLSALSQTEKPRQRLALSLNVLKADGEQMPTSCSMVWSEEEQVFDCIVRDMTEFNALEEKAHHAQRLDSIGVLTGGIAHDFNNLLSIIVGNSEFLAGRLVDQRDRRMAELILQAAERGSALTGQLLAFARRQPLTPEDCDIIAIVTEVQPLLEQALGNKATLTLELEGPVPAVNIDRTQLIQALMNLCLNARDAMPDGGEMQIVIGLAQRLSELFPDSVINSADEFVAIRASDSGVGIGSEDLSRIFEPFFTTKGPGRGVGLGLSMLYGFVKQSHGVVDVCSRKNQGTTFTLSFPPSANPSPVLAEPVPEVPHLAPKSGRVLLVEDDELLHAHTRGLLESIGHKVIGALDAGEALDLLAGGDSFDLVITDVQLGPGMDGWQLGQHIASQHPNMRVIYVTGYAEPLPPSTVLREQILRKPYRKRQLLSAISTAFGQTAGNAESEA